MKNTTEEFLPTISIIVVVKNAISILPECFARIKQQNYPVKNIEILLIDGGSTDTTCEYGRNQGALVIDGGHPDNQEARRYIGICNAINEIILFIDADNFLPDRNWLRNMVMPFRNPRVGFSFTKWYGLEEGLSPFDKYYALLGGNDPVAYGLGRHDRVPLGRHSLPCGATLVSKFEEIEYIKFDVNNLPTLGCNGFLGRASLYAQLDLDDPNKFMHTDVHIDILSLHPEALYAIVPSTIIHATGKTLLSNLKKRIIYKAIHNDKYEKYRRYKVFDRKSKRDIICLAVNIIFGLTLIQPFIRAIIGYLETGKKEWLLHVIALPSMIVFYIYSELFNNFRKYSLRKNLVSENE